MGRPRTLPRCDQHAQNTYRTWEHADDVLHSLPDPDGRVYFCAPTGGYHLTTSTRSEHDRRMASGARPLTPEALDSITALATEYQTSRNAQLARRLAGSVPGLLRHIKHLNTPPIGEDQ